MLLRLRMQSEGLLMRWRCYGVILHKLCVRLGHPFRRLIPLEVDVDDAPRYYICRVCGAVGRVIKHE